MICYQAILTFLHLLIPVYSETPKTTSVTGTLTCSTALNEVKIQLMDQEGEKEIAKSVQKIFEVKGTVEKGHETYLKITHSCGTKSLECKKVSIYRIPKFYNGHGEPYKMGEINLNIHETFEMEECADPEAIEAAKHSLNGTFFDQPGFMKDPLEVESCDGNVATASHSQIRNMTRKLEELGVQLKALTPIMVAANFANDASRKKLYYRVVYAMTDYVAELMDSGKYMVVKSIDVC